MADGLITVKVNDSDVRQAFDEVEDAGGRRELASAFTRLKKPLRTDQLEHGKYQVAPDGKWPKLVRPRYLKGRKPSKPGVKRRRGRERKILGKLPRAVQYKADGTRLRAISRVRWSGVHQDGGRVGRNATVPQREHLWFSRSFLAIAGEEFEGRLLKPFRGAR